jgi:hypothetical protein
MKYMIALLAFSIFSVTPLSAGASDKPVIGAIEDITLLPWDIKLPARIDTGAATSSLDVCDVKVKGQHVTFTLPERCGGKTISKPLINWKTIRTSKGSAERPVVIIDICMGSKIIKTHFTLNDRSGMEYPVLIGRKTLRGKFVVDVSSKNISQPNCFGLTHEPLFDIEEK